MEENKRVKVDGERKSNNENHNQNNNENLIKFLVAHTIKPIKEIMIVSRIISRILIIIVTKK